MARSLLIVHRHDPLDARTWSGTPKHLADALERRDWRVTGAGVDPPDLAISIARRAHRALRLGSDSVRNPLLRRIRSLRLHRRLVKSDSDVVLHIGTLHLPWRWDRRPGRHHVMFADTTFALWARYRTETQPTPRWLVAVGEHDEARSFRAMDHIFVASERGRRSVIEDYGIEPSRVTTVGTGLGQELPEVAAHRPPGPAFRLLFVGKQRLYDKGLDILLDALRRVRADRPEVTLDVVGRLPASTEAAEGVTVHPWVEPGDLAALYAASDVFVLPARNEPWGLVYLEALSHGTPVMGVDRHAFCELAGDGRFGIVLDRPDAGVVAAALLRALDDRTRLAEMGQAGREHVERHVGWDLVATRMTQVVDVL